MARLRTIGALAMCLVTVLLRTGTAVAAGGGQGHEACDTSRDALPVNIVAGDLLRPILVDLYARSATFREQCRRIGEARHMRVFVEPVFGRQPLEGRARATIRRFAHGAVIAVVSIPVPLRRGESMELLGHEFEHLVEQVERVDLASLAGTSGASRAGDGAFETRRAIEAGRRVEGEGNAPPPTAPAASPVEPAAAPIPTSAIRGSLRY